MLSKSFWTCRHTYRRSCINTLRCLAGCSVGDYSALVYLGVFHPELSATVTVPISMISGISTSLLLETTLLTFGKDKMPLKKSYNVDKIMSLQCFPVFQECKCMYVT